MSRVVAIVQARLGSTRLPGKALADLGDRPLLAQVVARARQLPVAEIVVATSDSERDDRLAALCTERGWACHRGSEDDVLDRYRDAADAFAADVVVRVTSDCPFVCPVEGGRVVERLLETGSDLAHDLTVFGSGMPLGAGVEAVTREALETCWREGREPHHREHVLEYVYEHPERFVVERVDAPEDVRRPGYRLTIDTAADLELVRRICARLPGELVALAEVVALLDAEPGLAALNAPVEQRTV